MSRIDVPLALVATVIGLGLGLTLAAVLAWLAEELLLAGVGLFVLVVVIALRETMTERLLARRMTGASGTGDDAEGRRRARIARFGATIGVVLACLVVLFRMRGTI